MNASTTEVPAGGGSGGSGDDGLGTVADALGIAGLLVSAALCVLLYLLRNRKACMARVLNRCCCCCGPWSEDRVGALADRVEALRPISPAPSLRPPSLAVRDANRSSETRSVSRDWEHGPPVPERLYRRSMAVSDLAALEASVLEPPGIVVESATPSSTRSASYVDPYVSDEEAFENPLTESISAGALAEKERLARGSCKRCFTGSTTQAEGHSH